MMMMSECIQSSFKSDEDEIRHDSSFRHRLIQLDFWYDIILSTYAYEKNFNAYASCTKSWSICDMPICSLQNNSFLLTYLQHTQVYTCLNQFLSSFCVGRQLLNKLQYSATEHVTFRLRFCGKKREFTAHVIIILQHHTSASGDPQLWPATIYE